MSENYDETYATTVPDTLVLKLEEIRDDKKETSVYFFYDPSKDVFVIRGKRKGGNTFSFECGSAESTGDFVRFILDSDCRVNYILYNYKDLSAYADNISYKTLSEGAKEKMIIAAFDEVTRAEVDYEKRYDIVERLRMLRNVFNLNIPGMGLDL